MSVAETFVYMGAIITICLLVVYDRLRERALREIELDAYRKRAERAEKREDDLFRTLTSLQIQRINGRNNIKETNLKWDHNKNGFVETDTNTDTNINNMGFVKKTTKIVKKQRPKTTTTGNQG